MTGKHRRYLAVEAAVSAGINAALSVAFGLLVFGGSATVGLAALIRDAVPQSFMIALMASLVPMLLTRKRLSQGAIAPLAPGGQRPNVLVASLTAAVVVAAVAWAVHRALLPLLLPMAMPFGAVLVGKAVYGAALGAAVTLMAVRYALAGSGDGRI